MKKNAEAAASLVQQAIRETGSDFALSSARSYLLAALRELTKVQGKREKRENNFRREMIEKEKKRLSLEETKRRIKVLDEMYALEQAKLQSGSDQS